ncbi:MAG: glycosyltransferase family 9 protein [Chloroflexota bacterium]|nr:glycosyltransferase family 9 protein [Chloroflexota bacterium]
MPEKAPQRILLLMLLPIGDTLFATPAVRALRERYPEAHITALVYPTNEGILRHNPSIDSFLFWPTREKWPGFMAVARLFLHLRRAHFDLAVEFCNYIWWVTLWSGIRRRTEMNLPKMWWALPWAGTQWRKRHAVEHYSDVVRRLGIPVHDTHLLIYPSAEEIAHAESRLSGHRISPDDTLVGMHLGGEGLWGRKRWPVEKFAEVTNGFLEIGARVVIMGGKEEVALAEELVRRAHFPVINAAGQTTLGETAALAARCTLFIGNDSSPLHIAAASGTRVLGIYGPTDPRSYHPWIPGGKNGVDYCVVRPNLLCAGRFAFVGGATLVTWAECLFCPGLKMVTPRQVLSAALSLIRK